MKTMNSPIYYFSPQCAGKNITPHHFVFLYITVQSAVLYFHQNLLDKNCKIWESTKSFILQKYKLPQAQSLSEPIFQLEDISCHKCFTQTTFKTNFEFHCGLTSHNSHQYQQQLKPEMLQELPLLGELNCQTHFSIFCFHYSVLFTN